MNKRFFSCGVVLTGLIALVSAGTVYADSPMPLGDFHVHPALGVGFPYTLGSVPSPYTTLVASNLGNPIAGGDFFGTINSQVWIDSSSGFLAFEYWFDITGATSPVRSATIGGDWTPFTVYEVGSDSSGLSTPVRAGGAPWSVGDPETIGRLPGSGFGAPTIVWENPVLAEGSTIGTGESSAHFWYTTDATVYAKDSLDLLDGGLSGDADVFIPVAVPAPAAWVLGALGLGLVGWIKRRLA